MAGKREEQQFDFKIVCSKSWQKKFSRLMDSRTIAAYETFWKMEFKKLNLVKNWEIQKIIILDIRIL